MPSKLRAVFLDAGGTLLYPHPSFHSLIAQTCQRAGLTVTEGQLATAEPAVFRSIAQREDGGRGYSFHPEVSRAFWIWVYESFLIEVGQPEAARGDLPRTLWETFTNPRNYRLYDDAFETLEQLRAAGLTLGIVSNWEAWLEPMLEELGIARFFDFTLVSGVCRIEKPDPEMFHLALEQAGVSPSEAAHVGDSVRDDVLGAAAVGIRGILLDRSVSPAWILNARAEGARIPPENVVRSLLELPARLGITSTR